MHRKRRSVAGEYGPARALESNQSRSWVVTPLGQSDGLIRFKGKVKIRSCADTVKHHDGQTRTSTSRCRVMKHPVHIVLVHT